MSHLRQPLLTLSVSRGDQCLLGLMNEERWALHDVTSWVQHGSGSFGVRRGGSDATGRLSQCFQGLSRLPGCYSYTHNQRYDNGYIQECILDIILPFMTLHHVRFLMHRKVFSLSWQMCFIWFENFPSALKSKDIMKVLKRLWKICFNLRRSENRQG